jgi:hypothetical protein
MKELLENGKKDPSKYFCIDDENYMIKGNRFSKERKYIQLEFRS